jgi:hypothetical protein
MDIAECSDPCLDAACVEECVAQGCTSARSAFRALDACVGRESDLGGYCEIECEIDPDYCVACLREACASEIGQCRDNAC